MDGSRSGPGLVIDSIKRAGPNSLKVAQFPFLIFNPTVAQNKETNNTTSGNLGVGAERK